jgi:peptidoglycan-associated lipoprotein
MKRRLLPLLALIAMTVSSCSRSGSEMWDDTRTAGRYMGQGIWSLFGSHGESRQVTDSSAFAVNTPEDFIPLQDEQSYRRLTMGDVSSLDQITADSSIPAASESPGDPGSMLPGFDAFGDASALGLGSVFQPIRFPYNSNLVKGQENLVRLKEIAAHMRNNPHTYLFVEGHCDERGAAAYNLALGARRANAIRNLLIKEGVNLDHIFTISYGKERPATSGHDEMTWSQNRRAQFRIFKKS